MSADFWLTDTLTYSYLLDLDVQVKLEDLPTA